MMRTKIVHSYRYQWYVNSNVSEQTETLDGTSFNYFDRIRYEVTPNDIYSGLTVSSSTVTIQNSIPSVGSAFHSRQILLLPIRP